MRVAKFIGYRNNYYVLSIQKMHVLYCDYRNISIKVLMSFVRVAMLDEPYNEPVLITNLSVYGR